MYLVNTQINVLIKYRTVPYGMEIENYLGHLGISAAKELCKELFQYLKTNPNRSEFDREFSKILSIYGATIYADNIITFLAKNGFISITNSYVNATKKLIIDGQQGGFEVKDDFRMGTDTVFAKGGKGTSIRGRGKIDFNDGGITFSV